MQSPRRREYPRRLNVNGGRREALRSAINAVLTLMLRCATALHIMPLRLAARILEQLMSNFENLLVSGSTERPDCRCGTEMRLIQVRPQGQADVRVFRCDSCGHELQLAVWKEADLPPLEPGAI